MTLTAFLIANKATILTILLVISEALGASTAVKSNGILSFVILQVEALLKKNAGK